MSDTKNNLLDLSKDQEIPGVDLTPDAEGMAESANVLDELFKQVGGDEPAAPEDKDKPAAPVAEKKEEPAAPAPEKKDEPAAPAAEKKEEPAAPAPEKKEEPAAPEPDELDKIELPPHAKPKTVESFAKVKEVARTRIALVQKERDEIKSQVAALETKVSEAGKLSPETEKELKELREFRSKLDVEADPAFKAFEKQIATNDESIFAKLKEVGVKDDAIAKIKELGVDGVDWEGILTRLPAQARRYVESKLTSNEETRENRTRAIADAKKNASEYVEKRSKETSQNTEEKVKLTEKAFQEHTIKLPWFKKIEAPATATPQEKAMIEAHNKFLAETQEDIKQSIADESPEGKAILALGYVQMLRLQKEVAGLKTKHAEDLKVKDSEISKLSDSVKEKEAFIAKIKKSSSTSVRSSAVPDGKAARQVAVDEDPRDAIDRLREETTAE